MDISFRKKIGFRISAYIFMGFVLFSVLLLWFLFYSAETRRQTELEIYRVHGRTMLNNFSSAVVFSLLSKSKDLMEGEVDNLLADPSIFYAGVYDESLKTAVEKSRVSNSMPPLDSSRLKKIEKLEAQVIRGLDGKEYLDFIMPVRSQSDMPGVAAGSKQAIGWVRLGISLNRMNEQIRTAWTVGLLLFLALALMVLFMVMMVQRRVVPPVTRLAAAARRMGGGDYDVKVEVSSDDEIGLLSATFNEMAENLRLQRSRLESLFNNIEEAVELLTETTTQLLSITSEQAAGATEQAAIVQEVVSTAEEISNTANRIAQASESVHGASQNASNACEQGTGFVETVIQRMDEIKAQVDRATNHIMELANQAQMIGTVIDIIEEISEQTNLLALNAAIEAAGAGEAGRRFSVVASEVRNLANRTLESTDSVRKMVETIRNSTSAMVLMSENERKAVADGVEAVEKMGGYFQHILELVETTTRAASEIGLITRQQSSATEQMVSSMKEVESVTREVEKGVKEVEQYMSHLKELTERLKKTLEERT